MILSECFKQVEHRNDGVLERLIDPQDSCSYLFPYRLSIVAGVDREIDLQEFDHREVRHLTTVRGRPRLQNEPAFGIWGMNKLVEQSRLAYPGFSNQCDNLPATIGRGL